MFGTHPNIMSIYSFGVCFWHPQTLQGPQSMCLILKIPVEWVWPGRKTKASHSSADMTAATLKLR